MRSKLFRSFDTLWSIMAAVKQSVAVDHEYEK